VQHLLVDVADLDAGDIVRFAIVIENTGGFYATDVTINDNFPAGTSIPSGGLNMTAALGDGTALGVVGDLFLPSGAPDPTGVSFTQSGSEVYIGAGRVDSAPVNDGSNIIAAVDGGVDYTNGTSSNKWVDDATVETEPLSIQKNLVSSGIIDSTNPLNRAVAGEYITYQVVVDVPEGTVPLLQVRDAIDADVRFDELISVTPSSSAITTDLAGGFGAVSAPASGYSGTVTLDLGNVTNSDTNNTVAESIEIVYRVYVRQNANDFALIRNRAELYWDTNDNGVTDRSTIWDRAPNLRVITPFLDVQKVIAGVGPTDVGDPITYTITVKHASNSDTTAFNVDFSDTLPSQIGSVSLDSVVDGAGAPVTGFTIAGNTISNPDFDLPLGLDHTRPCRSR